MSTYRIARKLSVAPRVVEGFVGVEAATERPVIVKRLVPPWAKEGTLQGSQYAWLAQQAKGLAGLPEWLEIGSGRGSVWLVEGLHEAESLRQVVSLLAKEQHGFLAPNEGLAVVAEVASLLSRMHQAPVPVVHGDLCASTVLLDAEGRISLGEAGLTTLLAPSSSTGPARSEVFALAPEQFTARPTPATDVFRLGLMLYELSVGHALFHSLDPVQALVRCQRYTGVARDAVKQVPEPWQSLIVDTLAVEPADRPSAAQVSATLAQAALKAGWKAPSEAIARLFARACTHRTSLESLARGGTQELVVTPLPPIEPVPEVLASAPAAEEEAKQALTNTFSKLPPVPPASVTPAVVAGPPTLQPVPTPAPARTPSGVLPPMTPGGAVVGRITMRKMTRSELEAVRAEEEAKPPPPPSPAASPSRVKDRGGPKDLRVGEMLLEKGVITREQLDEARGQAEHFGCSLADALASLGACDEDLLVVTVAEVTKTPHTTSEKLSAMGPPAEALERISLALAQELELVPLGLKGGTQLMVAMKDPMDGAALERLKAVTGLKSVVAVRAGENAIRRTRNRFYLGSEDATPDWLETAGGSTVALASPRPAPAVVPVPARSAELELPAIRGAPLPDDFGAGPVGTLPVTLEAPAGRLVKGLLMLLGERGTQAGQLAAFSVALARRLGLAGEELERVEFAAVALAVANLIDGRPVHDVPTIASLSSVLGESAWNELEPLLSPWLEWPAPHPGGPGAQAICAAFGFGAHAGLPRPTGNRLSGALVSFKARFKLEAEPLAALSRELGLG